MITCPHSKGDIMCSKCCELKPYAQFKQCKNGCMECNECGWFWGSGHDKLAGKPAYRSDDK